MSEELHNLLKRIRKVAEQTDMPIDKSVYDKCSKDHLEPILYGGTINAGMGVLARDLGKDEVINGEPLIGAGGQKLRRILSEYYTGKVSAKTEVHHKEAMNHIMFTNIVPYKPIGNKVFSKKIRQRFSLLIAEFLIKYWKGSYLMTLGTEAFKWFELFCDKDRLEEFWNDDNRYEKVIKCEISAEIDGKKQRKLISIAPLPHPSPLNRRWTQQFPDLLKNRLKSSD